MPSKNINEISDKLGVPRSKILDGIAQSAYANARMGNPNTTKMMVKSLASFMFDSKDGTNKA